MKSSKRFLWSLVAALAIAGGSYLGTVEFNHNYAHADTTAQTARPAPEPKGDTVAAIGELSRAFRSVHHAIKDAVVNIHVVDAPVADKNPHHRLPEGFQFPDGFEFPPGFSPDNILPRGRGPVEGTGSGVIVSADGYILTNNHVVEGATDITVTLDDGRDLKAKVVGTDPKTDLAVVKVTADHLTYARFGDSDSMEVGDWVLAFGSPFGFKQTMTQGIISAKGRRIDIISSHNPTIEGLTYENFLQTDAAINPGNSGGPLVNLKGEIIGLNTAIASNSGGYNGVGFAIPSNDAQYIMDSLIKNGKVVRGFLNVKIEDIDHPAPQDQALVDSIRKTGFTGKGALVRDIDPDGPAGKGGVQSGDVITAMDGKAVETVDELRNRVARLAPGTKVTLSVYRDGKAIELSFPLGTQPAQNAAYARTSGKESSAIEGNSDLGVSVKSVDKATAEKYHLGAESGVIVTDISPESIAGIMGVKSGDVITRVNKTDVNTPQEFNEALGKAKLSEGVRLSVRTADGMERLVFVQKK